MSKTTIKYLQKLSNKNFRYEKRQFVIEGIRSIQSILVKKTEQIEKIFISKEMLQKHQSLFNSIEKSKIEIQEHLFFKRTSLLKTPNEVLALVNFFKNPECSISSQNWSLGLERIQDPGNLGTIIRIADWFGIQNIFCSLDCVDLYNSKTIQSSVGSICNVNVHYVDLKKLLDTHPHATKVATTLDGKDYRTSDEWKKTKGLLLFGNEAQGLSKELLNECNFSIKIPSIQKIDISAESLNVSVSCGIILANL